MKADLSSLGRWLNSWVQPTGAIHGFHNHSVWGDNPFRYGDFTAGHSTFASPFILGLSTALAKKPDHRGLELAKRLIEFQTGSFQTDGQFAHIGFQVGEMLKAGLVHNAVPLASLCGSVLILGDQLSAPLIEKVDQAARKNFAATDKIHGTGPGMGSCVNQEYVRIWARLVHMQAFRHHEWDELVQAGLDFLIDNAHVRGLPDDQSAGTLRSPSDKTFIEPAEYYGLMIHPLLIASERYSNKRYFEEAAAISRHVARSAWTDASKQTRVHRLYHQVDGTWHCIHEPMLIGGIGLTLSGIHAATRIRPDDEFEKFLTAMDKTYAHYQSPAGFFLAASGWGSEQDIIPSSAWQSHDFYHLTQRHELPADFWDTVFTPDPRAAVVFGQSMWWIEAGPFWQVRGYNSANGLELVGRKDRVPFHIDIPGWIGSGKESPEEYHMPDRPEFVKTDSQIIQISGRPDVQVLSGGCRAAGGGEEREFRGRQVNA